MMRRLISAACALAVVAAGTASANAAATSLGTAHAAAVSVTPGTGITADVSTNGDLAGLLDFLTPVLDQFVTPLSSALQSLPDNAVSSLVTGFGPSLVADSSGTALAAPAAGSYPSCDGDWAAGNCYSASGAGTPGAVVAVGGDSAQGWATADTTGVAASTRLQGVTLSALGIDVGSLGTIASSASCDTNQNCTSTGSATGVSLLGGAVAAKSADDGSLLVSIDNGDYTSVSALADTTVTAGGRTATVHSNGTRLEVSIGLTLDELVSALGLTNPLADLNAADSGSTISLDVFLGSGATADNRAAGLRVGLGVNADINVSVFDLIGANVTATDSSGGDMAGLQLADTSATSSAGDPTGLGDAPPAVK